MPADSMDQTSLHSGKKKARAPGLVSRETIAIRSFLFDTTLESRLTFDSFFWIEEKRTIPWRGRDG